MRFSQRSLVNGTLALMVILALCLALFVSIRGAAHASPGTSLQLSRKSGPPTTVLTVNGVGYGVNEMVALDFNARQVSTTTSSSTGTFSTSIKIPASALPGLYEVKATGQTSGHSAQSAFLVQTDWTMFGFNHQQTRFNPYENVLTPANAQGLKLKWSYATMSYIDSSPAIANGVVYVGWSALDATTGALKWSYVSSSERNGLYR